MKQDVFETIEMEPGFFRIENGGVRCFFIEGDDRAMLVDTGFGNGDLRSLVQSLTKLPIFVVNTHADGDHTGCNHQFQEIWMHPAEFDYYAQKGNTCDNLHPLWEGDTLSLGKWNFEVLLIPGHTPGSIALLIVNTKSSSVGTVSKLGQSIYLARNEIFPLISRASINSNRSEIRSGKSCPPTGRFLSLRIPFLNCWKSLPNFLQGNMPDSLIPVDGHAKNMTAVWQSSSIRLCIRFKPMDLHHISQKIIRKKCKPWRNDYESIVSQRKPACTRLHLHCIIRSGKTAP